MSNYLLKRNSNDDICLFKDNMSLGCFPISLVKNNYLSSYEFEYLKRNNYLELSDAIGKKLERYLMVKKFYVKKTMAPGTPIQSIVRENLNDFLKNKNNKNEQKTSKYD